MVQSFGLSFSSTGLEKATNFFGFAAKEFTSAAKSLRAHFVNEMPIIESLLPNSFNFSALFVVKYRNFEPTLACYNLSRYMKNEKNVREY